jgi:hypothetical protein
LGVALLVITIVFLYNINRFNRSNFALIKSALLLQDVATKEYVSESRAQSISHSIASGHVTGAVQELSRRMDFALNSRVGNDHLSLRRRFILDQLSQQDDFHVVVFGDSIIEGMHMPSLNGCAVINGGIGGAGIMTVVDLFRDIGDYDDIKTVVIAIGINDVAHLAGRPAPNFSAWEGIYSSFIADLVAMKRFRIVLSTVLPVEGDKPLARDHFAQDSVDRINAIKRRVALEHNLTLIDHDERFLAKKAGGVEFTTDGIHLNKSGYQAFKENLAAAPVSCR